MTKEVLEMSKKASSEEGPMSNYWTPSEKENLKELYGCEILVENGTAEEVSNRQFPNYARIVSYEVEGKMRYDLTRGEKVSKIFDMYWDKFRDGVKKIGFGYGKINPRLWGYQPKSKKRK